MSPAWRQARAWLLPALAPGDGGEAELIAELAVGDAQLWLGEQGAIVTQRIEEDGGPVLHVWLAGGRLAGVMALRAGIEAWARGQGCIAITIDGRAGWSRLLRSHGYAAQGGELRRRL